MMGKRRAHEGRKKKTTAAPEDDPRELLHEFCSAVESEAEIPRGIREYLYFAFVEYLSGEKSIEKALRLSMPSSRPAGSHAWKPHRVVAWLYLLIKRDGLSKTQAKAKLEDQGIQPRNVERYDADNNAIRDMSVPELEKILGIAEKRDKK